MKKRCLLPSAVLLLMLALTACSSSTSTTAPIPYVENSVNESVSSNAGTEGDIVTGSGMEIAPQTAPTSIPDGGDTTVDVHNTTNVKRILRATVSIQTTRFDVAIATLEQLVSSQNGYFESAEIQQGSYYDTQSTRYGNYVIRIPQEKYDAFLTATGNVGHVVNISKSAQDVGQEYFDTETHLKTLRTQQDRLLALLEKADTMENIISLESALADVEYQIEQYSTTLRRYDSLIGYSTVNLTLDEVLEITEQPKETVLLGERVANAFQGGMDSFARGVGNFVVWLAYNLIGVLLFLAVAAGSTVFIIRCLRKKHTSPTVVPNPSEENKK